jgi:RNA polymerase sigma factor (sigma-70 family)
MPTDKTGNKDLRYLQGLKNQTLEVLQEIYDNYFPSIKGHIINNSGKEEDAEDVFHDALIVIYRKVKDDSLELTSSFHTYFFAICKNLWLKKLNRKKRQSRVTIEDAEVLTMENDTEKAIETTERFALYREKFQLLGEDCQKLLQLYFEKKNMKEIANTMGFGSEGYARKRKFQCKEKLTKLIQSDDRFNELR